MIEKVFDSAETRKDASVAFAQIAGTSPHLYRNARAVGGTMERNVRVISWPALSKDCIKKGNGCDAAT